MNEDALGPEFGPLQRAKLHIRGGKRRLRQGKVSAGIITLYDALLQAMKWYVASPARLGRLAIEPGEDLADDKTAYRVLVRSGVLDGSFDYPAFDRLVGEVVDVELSPDQDCTELVKGIDSVMTQLGVMPFDESALPPEDPSTF